MVYDLTSTLPNLDLNNKIIFFRADFNVSLDQLDDDPQRLTSLLPTLDSVLSRGARVVLASHIGRPHGHEAALSTIHLMPWFTRNGYTLAHADTPEKAYEIIAAGSVHLVLLENLRFWPEEKAGDRAFARRLKGTAHYYLNDAFASLHRKDTSIALVPTLFDRKNKTIGFLIEEELKALNPLLERPKKPYLIVMGGGKPDDKIPLIPGLLDYATMIIMCPALVFTFMKAQGYEVGKSLIAVKEQKRTCEIIQRAVEKNVEIFFPVDYVVADDTFDGPLSLINAHDFKPHHVGISIGPETVKLLEPRIAEAQTIFFNAAMGTLKRPETMHGVRGLLERIVQSPAYTVIGGGDSVAAATFFNLADRASWCSTGGGATLHLISGSTLPGLEALLH